jgi:hypothetical protein
VTIEELTNLLVRIQVLDNRQVDQLTIEAWAPLMADVPYAAAVDAVNAHFRTSTAYLQPAHIVQGVHAARRLELPETMSPTAPDSCEPRRPHRWLADGTCMLCTTRREVPGA